MSSPLVKQVDKPFLVIPSQPAQSTVLAKPSTSWAQQQIANQGGNTMTWLPSMDPIKAPTQSKQTLNMGGMTVDLLPTDDPLTRQSLPTMVQKPTQTAAQMAMDYQVAQQLQQSSIINQLQITPQQPTTQGSDIQAGLQAGAVDVLGMGIFETPATAFAFANPTSETPYLMYGAIALVVCLLAYYMYRENYI
jgi:uncharacterized membrane protein YjfL (UPF0719 family)